MSGDAISFGPFRLLAARRLLLEGDKPVRLGSRAFEILVLVERGGKVVGKEELIARAWPKIFIEEVEPEDPGQRFASRARRRPGRPSLHRHRARAWLQFRRAGAASRSRHGTAQPQSIAPTGLHNLPFAVTRMIGREDAVAALVARLSRERLVTIVGPGGIGKTTVALAVAERVIADYEHGVWLVDLAPIGDARLVPSAVATVLGLEIRSDNPLPGLVAGLRDKRMLLLLDNCEHVIDAAACLAAAVLGGAPGVKILATSREPLGRRRRAPLSPRTAEQPAIVAGTDRRRSGDLSCRAIVRRACNGDRRRLHAHRHEHSAGRRDLPEARRLAACDRVRRAARRGAWGRRPGRAPRRQLAAVGRAAPHGAAATSDDAGRPRLELRFAERGRAAVLPGIRHLQRRLYGRRCCGRGRRKDADRCNGPLADLVAKSLVVADVSGAEPRFRLLDTTRAYAIEQARRERRARRIARRHAEYYRDLFERAEGEVRGAARGRMAGEYAREIDNLRAALDWAFSPGGDRSIGVLLTAAAVPLWLRLSLLRGMPGPRQAGARRARRRGDARAARRNAAQRRAGYSNAQPSEMGAAFTKALEIADSLGDTECQLRALGGLYFLSRREQSTPSALPLAQKFQNLARSGSDLNDRLFGECIIGVAKHYMGDQIGARRHLELVLTQYAAADHRTRISFAFRPTCRCGRALAGEGAVAAGVFRSGGARGRTSVERRRGSRSCGVALLALSSSRHARSRCGREISPLRRITRNAARQFGRAWPVALERVRRRFQRVVVLRKAIPTRGRGRHSRPGRGRRTGLSFRFWTGLSRTGRGFDLRRADRRGARAAGSSDRAVGGGLDHAGTAAPQGRTLSVGEARLRPCRRRRACSGRRWMRRAGKGRCLGSCAPRRASPA